MIRNKNNYQSNVYYFPSLFDSINNDQDNKKPITYFFSNKKPKIKINLLNINNKKRNINEISQPKIYSIEKTKENKNTGTIIKNDEHNNKLINSIFQESKNIIKLKKNNNFPNILNILYSENTNQFNKIFSKHIQKESLKGLCLTRISSSPDVIMNKINSKIEKMKNKLSLIKSIIDYSYPEIVIRQFINQANEFNKKMGKINIPYKQILFQKFMNENKINEYYSSLLKIHNYKNKCQNKAIQKPYFDNLNYIANKKLKNNRKNKILALKSFSFDFVNNKNRKFKI